MNGVFENGERALVGDLKIHGGGGGREFESRYGSLDETGSDSDLILVAIERDLQAAVVIGEQMIVHDFVIPQADGGDGNARVLSIQGRGGDLHMYVAEGTSARKPLLHGGAETGVGHAVKGREAGAMTIGFDGPIPDGEVGIDVGVAPKLCLRQRVRERIHMEG